MKIGGILEKIVQIHRFKKKCFGYVKWLKLLKKHGEKMVQK